MREELRQAALDLASPARTDRERAEHTLIEAREDAIPALIHALEHTPDPPREKPIRRAALLLGALRAREGLDALYEAALDGDTKDEDRAFIGRALAEILDGRDAFDDRARDVLEILAASPDRYARAFAAQAFGALGDIRSRARVEALAEDDDEWVRDKAAAVLANLAEAAALAEGVDLGDFAALVDQANDQGGTLKPFLDDLGDHRAAVRERAAVELIRAGKRSIPFLIDKLNQPDVLPRIGAAQVLGRLQAPEAAGPLLIAATTAPATEQERELIPIALRALANCLTGAEVGLADSLLPLARSGDRFVRAAALLCLGRISDREGILAVTRSLTDADPFVVESASIALSEGVREDDAGLVRPLLEAFDGLDGRASFALREAILIALSRIQIDSEPLRVRVRHRVRREIFGPTAAVRKAAVALLERLYGEDDPPPLPVTDLVLTRLADDHPEVRVVAASFLSSHLEPGFTGAAAKLEAATKRGERTVALLALEALRRHDTTGARDVLAGATANADAAVAQRAAELVDGFEPGTPEWTFTPKVAPPSPPPSRPTRVRRVDDEAPPPDDDEERGPTVEARFDD
jgi:HEAT repeat protein